MNGQGRGGRGSGMARRITVAVAAVVGLALASGGPRTADAAPVERDPVTLSVVVVNPSSEKPQSTPVRIDLPMEVTPKDVIDKGELDLEFDEDRSFYFVYKEAVEL